MELHVKQVTTLAFDTAQAWHLVTGDNFTFSISSTVISIFYSMTYNFWVNNLHFREM